MAVVVVGVDDLDLDLLRRVYLPASVAPEILEENVRGTQQQLASLRLATPDSVPTVLGVLVTGRDPLARAILVKAGL